MIIYYIVRFVIIFRTDKTGDIHIMHGLIKSHNKLTNTLNMRVDIINKKDPTMSI